MAAQPAGDVAREAAGDQLEPVPQRELLARVRKGLVTVIDVRPAEEFAAGHIPGALNVPLAELDTWSQRAPHDREIVAYCRGPYCVFAYEAVVRLRRKGFDARLCRFLLISYDELKARVLAGATDAGAVLAAACDPGWPGSCSSGSGSRATSPSAGWASAVAWRWAAWARH